ncbi:MAG: hypothetical protein ASARMPRED_008203 [Alectoria sarmentosa]|nr:MAG: hypothetical protein ASARMPRED_008203 [Alectoria sarmentosa]
MSISPTEAAFQLAHAHQSKTGQLIGSTGTLSALATVLVLARFITRVHTKVGLKADDWAVVIAMLFAWGEFVTIVICGHNGLGKHLITVTPEETTVLEKALYANVLLFPIAICIIQLSILLFYVRVFTLRDARFKIALLVCAGLSVGVCVSQVLPTISQCSPIAYSWNKAIVGGHCINVHVMWIVQDILFLVLNIYVVVLPLPMVWNLQITRPEKIAISGMFLLGSFIAVVNLIRLPQLISVGVDDLTYSDVGAAIWSQAEVCLGIVAACLPCLRPLMFLLFTSLKSGSSYLSWRRSKATASYQMHSVQRKDSLRSSAGQRLNAFANETWTSHPIARCEDTYPGERINEGARVGWKGTNTGPDEVDADLERGIWKKVTLEISRDTNRQD